MSSENQVPSRRHSKRWILAAGIALAILAMAIGMFLVWNTVAENRRKARAEQAVHTALKQWCSDEPLDQVRDTKSGDFFDEFGSRMATAPRPTTYQISDIFWVRGGAYSVYRVPVTLSFVGGPETRQYEVEVHKKSGKCFIKTVASDDISGTESYARIVLQAWLDCWVGGGDMAAFKKEHPEADAKMTMDIAWADFKSKGKRLVQYEVTSVTAAPGGGYRFAVTATLEDRGMPETKILRYAVRKDRVLSGGRWSVTGN